MTSSLVNSVSTEIRRLRIRLVPVSSRLDGLSGYVLVPTATRLLVCAATRQRVYAPTRLSFYSTTRPLGFSASRPCALRLRYFMIMRQ